MKTILLAISMCVVALGCGDGSQGSTNRAIGPAPECVPPADLCTDHPEVNGADGPWFRVLKCPEGYVQIANGTDEVMGWTTGDGTPEEIGVSCWVGTGTVAMRVGRGLPVSECWGEDGEPEDCEVVVDDLTEARRSSGQVPRPDDPRLPHFAPGEGPDEN